MAQPKNRDQFVELEYCFEQYFNKNFAPIINREYNELNKKQLEEYSRTLDRHQSSSSQVRRTEGGSGRELRAAGFRK